MLAKSLGMRDFRMLMGSPGPCVCNRRTWIFRLHEIEAKMRMMLGWLDAGDTAKTRLRIPVSACPDPTSSMFPATGKRLLRKAITVILSSADSCDDSNELDNLHHCAPVKYCRSGVQTHSDLGGSVDCSI